ncbi:hypothetical protein SCACP_17430 [Sporomusa carbonis]|uniref:hypothetical protein n=1 Tax=Sporomusa carbonis TaxID=3076075 RepID=UPI003A5D35BB
MLKSSYKSSSTSSLYEFAEELTNSVDKTNAKQENTAAKSEAANGDFTYSMEFPTNAYAHPSREIDYDIG